MRFARTVALSSAFVVATTIGAPAGMAQADTSQTHQSAPSGQERVRDTERTMLFISIKTYPTVPRRSWWLSCHNSIVNTHPKAEAVCNQLRTASFDLFVPTPDGTQNTTMFSGQETAIIFGHVRGHWVEFELRGHWVESEFRWEDEARWDAVKFLFPSIPSTPFHIGDTQSTTWPVLAG